MQQCASEHHGGGIGCVGGGEIEIINCLVCGNQSLPIPLLLGFEDYLKTTKVKCKQDKENNVGNLTVQGAIAVEEIDIRLISGFGADSKSE